MPSLAREPKPRCLRWLLLESRSCRKRASGREREGGEKLEDGTKVEESKSKWRVGEEKQRTSGGDRRGVRGAADKRKAREVLEKGSRLWEEVVA